MKLKNFWKRFWTLDRHTSAGFTLVELIVVIAILAILAGVAIPVYSGYINKTNKGADQTMVTTMLNSLEMAAIMEPKEFPETMTIYLSAGEMDYSSSDDNKTNEIFTAAYGSGYAQQLKLKYGKWALGEIVVTHVNNLNNKLTEVGGDLSYKEDVNALWGEVENILVNFESTSKLESLYNGSSAELMASAADYTINGSAAADDSISQDAFAAMWANPSDTFTSYSTDIYSADISDAATLNPMLARFAAIKGRNHTFGNWLAAQDPSLSAAASKIQGSSNGQSAGGVGIPSHFLDVITTSNFCYDTWGSNNQAQAESLANCVNTYFGIPGYITAVSSDSYGYKLAVSGTATSVVGSQAYVDALGYYALMSAVDDSAEDTKGMTNDQYLDTMGNAVNNVGAMLKNPELVNTDGGFVSITVQKGENGMLSFYGSDPALDLSGRLQSGRGQGTTSSKASVVVTLDYVDGQLAFVVDGIFSLKTTETGSVTYVLGSTYKTELEQASKEFDNYDFVGEVMTGLNSILLSSSDTSKATVNGNNVVGVADGNAIITGTYGDISFSIPVEVNG